MIQDFLIIFLRLLVYTAIIVGVTLRVHKAMLRNNWTFRQFVSHRRYRFLMALCFVGLSLAYGFYKLQHPL